MRTLRLTLAYDGTNYVGWQRQLNGLSVQQLVEEALAPMTGDPPSVSGAGRTDAGVHAAGQVASVNVSFAFATDAVQRALNVRLPVDVRVLSVDEAPLGFHARFQARGKAYRYRVSTAPVQSPFDRHYVWHVPGTRNVAAMIGAAQAFIGRHDFASFQARGSDMADTVRTLERVEVLASEHEIAVEIEGDGFLRHMVRTMVGTLVEVGSGLRPAESVRGILDARDRQAAGPTAPAAGLTLMRVWY